MSAWERWWMAACMWEKWEKCSLLEREKCMWEERKWVKHAENRWNTQFHILGDITDYDSVAHNRLHIEFFKMMTSKQYVIFFKYRVNTQPKNLKNASARFLFHLVNSRSKISAKLKRETKKLEKKNHHVKTFVITK